MVGFFILTLCLARASALSADVSSAQSRLAQALAEEMRAMREAFEVKLAEAHAAAKAARADQRREARASALSRPREH